jgi:hypothetical protein
MYFVSFAESSAVHPTVGAFCDIVLWGCIHFQGVDQIAGGARARFRSFYFGSFLKTLGGARCKQEKTPSTLSALICMLEAGKLVARLL